MDTIWQYVLLYCHMNFDELSQVSVMQVCIKLFILGMIIVEKRLTNKASWRPFMLLLSFHPSTSPHAF